MRPREHRGERTNVARGRLTRVNTLNYLCAVATENEAAFVRLFALE